MSKKAETQYFKKIGREGVKRSLNKPFGDPQSGELLSQFAAILTVLPPPPARLLDLGCGTGWTSCFFAQHGYEVVGYDIAADAIRQARAYAKRHGINGVTFASGDYESLPYAEEFDVAVFFDSLHHAVDEQAAVDAAFKALKSGGTCVTSEPGQGHSTDVQAKEAVRKYGVTEKDMPPKLVKRLGKFAGFASASFFADPALVNRAAYRIPVSPLKRRILATPLVGGAIRAGSLLNVFRKKRNWGLVVLRKR